MLHDAASVKVEKTHVVLGRNHQKLAKYQGQVDRGMHSCAPAVTRVLKSTGAKFSACSSLVQQKAHEWLHELVLRTNSVVYIQAFFHFCIWRLHWQQNSQRPATHTHTHTYTNTHTTPVLCWTATQKTHTRRDRWHKPTVVAHICHGLK